MHICVGAVCCEASVKDANYYKYRYVEYYVVFGEMAANSKSSSLIAAAVLFSQHTYISFCARSNADSFIPDRQQHRGAMEGANEL